jgi:hypothetical protein
MTTFSSFATMSLICIFLFLCVIVILWLTAIILEEYEDEDDNF